MLVLANIFWFKTINATTDPSKKLSLSGFTKEKKSGEELFGTMVYVEELKSGAVSNAYGFYSISLDPGKYHIRVSAVGYKTQKIEIDLADNKKLDFEMENIEEQLKEVVVKGERANVNITKNEMSVSKLEMRSIKKIPALMGEVDVIKAVQLLPGVQATSEGGSGFSVRGGSSDQNMIILDEANVYNASHLLGFFSVFNNDAIQEIKLYKGDMPASSGGRLASLLDVRMKNGNQKEFKGTAGIGLISSRLTLEGPIGNGNTSYLISGRRSYLDLFLPLASNPDIKNNTLYFYDTNLKINTKLNENNRLFLSGYFGRDVFKNNFAQMGFGNQTFTLRWNHLYSDKLFMNTSVIYSSYDYMLGTSPGKAESFQWKARLSDYVAKMDYNWFLNPENEVKFGASASLHNINPGEVAGEGSKSMYNNFKLNDKKSLEYGIYLSNDQKIGSNLSIKYGIRYSLFSNQGLDTVYQYNQQFDTIGHKVYTKGDIFNLIGGFEPRVGANYIIDDVSSVKASYSRTRQYIQLAQNSSGGTPLDVWFSASPNVKPQIADQFAIGYFRNFADHTIEGSVEVFYKDMQNTIDFKDHAVLLLNKMMEGELRFGSSKAYGAEFLLKINKEKLNGWISYTYSKSTRKMDDISVNKGMSYSAPYDKPHNVAVVLNYLLSPRVTVSANWVYSTGMPYTSPAGRAEIGGKVLPIYSDRNENRYPDYHRLDLALSLEGKKKEGRRWQGEWVFSVYNAYGRKNAWAINFVPETDNPEKTYAEKTYLFSIIPSVTYNLNF